MPIEDRVVVVTGAAGKLGPTVCKRFADAGARLVLVGRDAGRLNALVESLGVEASRVLVQAANVNDPGEVAALAESVSQSVGGADALLHLVGGYQAGARVADTDPVDVGAMLNQHLWTTLHVCRALAPGMVARGWGRIVVISSPAAQTPAAKMAPYAVAKAAQETLILTLAQELKGTGVTANCILVRSIEAAPPDPAAARPRSGTSTEEIAAALLWLCSDEAGATNGARLPLFGRA